MTLARALARPIGAPLSCGVGMVGDDGPSGAFVGTTYYVDSTKSDSNDGLTPATAWASVSKVNGFSFQPGDTVIFTNGQTFTGPLVPPTSGGVVVPFALPSQITFKSAAGVPAIISQTDAAHGVDVTDKSYITISGLAITGLAAASTTGNGVNIYANAGVTVTTVIVQNCLITGAPAWGAKGWTAVDVGSFLRNCIFQDNVVDGCTLGEDNSLAPSDDNWQPGHTAGLGFRGGWGEQTTGKDFNAIGCIIRRNIVKNCAGKAGANNSWCGSGIFFSRHLNAIDEYNVCTDNGANCSAGSGPSGNWCGRGDNMWMHDNIVLRETCTGSTDGGGFDFDGAITNSLMERNFSAQCQGFGYNSFLYSSATANQTTGNVIRYNYGYDNGGGIRFVSNGDSGSEVLSANVYGNTFEQVSSSTEVVQLKRVTSAMVVNFYNNNFIVSKATGTSDLVNVTDSNVTQVVFAGNNWKSANTQRWTYNGSTYATLTLWRGTGQETYGGTSGTEVLPINIGFAAELLNGHSRAVNDNSVENLRPDEASPILGTGLNLTTAFGIDPGTKDFFGSTLGSDWSIGHAGKASALTAVNILSGTSWTVPANFGTLYAIDCVGGGKGNPAAATALGAGGGAAWARIKSTTTSLTPGASIPIVIGVGDNGATSGDTCWNATSLADAVSKTSAVACAAAGGKPGSGSTGGLGGDKANCVGTEANSGGKGADNTATGGGGGGGAAGAYGDGAAGATGNTQGGGGGGGANDGAVGSVAASTLGGAAGKGPYNQGVGTKGNFSSGNSTKGSGTSGAGNGGGASGTPTGDGWRDSTTGLYTSPSGGTGGEFNAGGGPTTNQGIGNGAGSRRATPGGPGMIRILYKKAA